MFGPGFVHVFFRGGESEEGPVVELTALAWLASGSGTSGAKETIRCCQTTESVKVIVIAIISNSEIYSTVQLFFTVVCLCD